MMKQLMGYIQQYRKYFILAPLFGGWRVPGRADFALPDGKNR